MNQDDYDYEQERRNENMKRIGSAVFTTIIIIIYIALRADDCSGGDDYSYDYSYTPSYGYGTTPSYESTLDKGKQVLEELMQKDAGWKPAIEMIDPAAHATNPKNALCTELDSVLSQTPTWKIELSEYVLAAGGMETTVKSTYPLFVMDQDDGFPQSSPEAIARATAMVQKLVDGSVTSAPSLIMKDLLLQTGVMPKPAKGQKKIKAIPPGTPIVRGWLYDHREERVVCAGVYAIPDFVKPAKGEELSLKLTEEQLGKIVLEAPKALRIVPMPDDAIMVEDPAPAKKPKAKKKKDVEAEQPSE